MIAMRMGSAVKTYRRHNGRSSSRTAQQQHIHSNCGRTTAAAAAVAQHARPRRPLARQLGQGRPVAHFEENLMCDNISQNDLLRLGDCVSDSSSSSSSSSSSGSNIKTTQQLHVAIATAAAERQQSSSSGETAVAVAEKQCELVPATHIKFHLRAIKTGIRRIFQH